MSLNFFSSLTHLEGGTLRGSGPLKARESTGKNLESQEPVGFEPREAHIATAAALVTGGAGRTWPPHLVWSLADPVAPGREKVPERWGQETQESCVNNLHICFQISAPPLAGCATLGKSHRQASVSSSVQPREDFPLSSTGMP